MQGDVRRIAIGPDGSRYEVVGMAKDWKLGTGSVLLDAAAFIWAVVRQARGKEWIVIVRRADTKAAPVVSRRARNREDAASIVEELYEAIESGQLPVSST
jgi:hypothetical protein